jgi:Spy/CpxP family protein refolding chaperone
MRFRHLLPALTLAAVVATTPLLTACSSHQDQGPGERPEMKRLDPEARFLEIRKALSLTDEQAPKVKAVLETERKAREELMGSEEKPDREMSDEMRTKMEDLEWESFKQLSKILTRDQMDAYSKYLEAEKAKMQERGPGGPDGGRGGHGGPPPRSR